MSMYEILVELRQLAREALGVYQAQKRQDRIQAVFSVYVATREYVRDNVASLASDAETVAKHYAEKFE